MTKRKKSSTFNSDTKVGLIVVGIFVLLLVFFSLFHKGKETHKVVHQENPPKASVYVVHKVTYKPTHKNFDRKGIPSPVEPVDSYIPNENVKPLPPVAEPVHPDVFHLPGAGGKIAFILDDWGQSTSNCKYLDEIHAPLAIAILPGLRHTRDVAACAHHYHKLAMLHLPLEAQNNHDFYPQDYIIKTNMNAAEVSQIVEQDIDQMPLIEGVNNHMGSKATADRPLMKIILNKLKEKGLFFVDSVTARRTVCASLAHEMGLSFSKRDVFLDNINTREAITRQMVQLAQKARRRGYAVAIGHDRRLTMQVLKEEIPLLEKDGFQIVSIRSLVKNK
ncbi:MAG: divergent polysaccharide deacetylase family protein [Candidatus Omnitrophica bacterium]|nr:divergent polysaccharide deacetylase family protein [Candidatus Omnitrophota bacterium]